ncbi:MAG: preprotein translocase subunit SecG [Candidatus Hydrogenedentes bacterium]|nr:preprotein translocase subunit SecG [Candidatus Hydrogenedentota bacterium]
MSEFIFRWETLWVLMLVLYVPACLGLIIVVLLQKGKGTGFAGAFGIGAGSDTVFGPRMSKSLPARLTYVMAGVFLVLAMAMSLVAGRLGRGIAPERVEEDAVMVESQAQQEAYQAGLEELGVGAVSEEPGARAEPAPSEVVPEGDGSPDAGGQDATPAPDGES